MTADVYPYNTLIKPAKIVLIVSSKNEFHDHVTGNTDIIVFKEGLYYS